MVVPILMSLVLAAIAPLSQHEARAQNQTPLRSATEFLSPELKAEQDDAARNRGMLYVEEGAALWEATGRRLPRSCAGCHGLIETSMRGVAAQLPAVDKVTGALVNLEGRINQCVTQRQNRAPLAYESGELLALTAAIARQSSGLPLAVATDGPAKPFLEKGRAFWTERQGQLNLSCAQCHDDNVGRKLRGDTISSAVTTGYPVYRLEWQGLGSLHRRLKACQLGVRAVQFEAGSPEYLALELYLAVRANGRRVEAPALRR